jgi:hypothetical protein
MVAVKLVVADPKLPKVIVAVTVVPTTPLAGKATVVLTSLNSGVKVADVAEALEPTEVVNEPAGMALISGLDELLVTTAETEQLAPGGTTDPTDIVIVPNPEVAAGVALAQVVVTNDGLAFNKPAGYWSVNNEEKVADVRACVLVNVITNSEVPPAEIVAGVNVLETKGRLGVTTSGSLAEHTPVSETQPVTVLVLVTPDGGVMDAVLVICVWAKAVAGINATSNNPATNAHALENRVNINFKKHARPSALECTISFAPNDI